MFIRQPMLKLSSTILSILISNWGCLGIFPPLVLVSFLLETCFMLSQPREPFFSPLILFPLRHATKCGATMHGIPVIGQQKLRPATETQFCTMKWPKYDKRSTYLTCHWLGVNLTHVQSTIVSLNNINGESPRIVPIVTHAHSGVVCNHMSVNC